MFSPATHNPRLRVIFFVENERRDGNVHGHIISVNEAHDEGRRGYRDDIPIEEEITAVNEGKLLIDCKQALVGVSRTSGRAAKAKYPC